MTEWTRDELAAFNQNETLQNQPFNDDKKSFEEDNPVWTVIVGQRVFIRGAKGPKNTKWYVAGTANGGHVAVAGKTFAVDYKAVQDANTIKAVNDALAKKYPGDPSLAPMTSELAQSATVELVKQ